MTHCAWIAAFGVFQATACDSAGPVSREGDSGPTRDGGGAPSGSGGVNSGGATGGRRGMDGSAGAGGRLDAGAPSRVDAGDASPVSSCGDSKVSAIRISAARLTKSPELETSVDLAGPGVAAIVSLRSVGLQVLRWANGHLVLLGEGGFWDVGLDGANHWYPLAGLLHSTLAADLDGDGDQDVLVATVRVEMVQTGSEPPSVAQVSHLVAWERTPAGLTERGDALTRPIYVGMPISTTDLDHDGKLDLVTYLNGTPVGHMNRGAFKFSATELGAKSDVYADDAAAIAALAADRNADGEDDLLVLVGSSLGTDAIVLLNDGQGRFMAPGAPAHEEPAQAGLAFGDVTGDGRVDVIVNSVISGPEFHLLASNGPSTFAPSITIGDGASGVQLADLDQDGQLDLLGMSETRFTAVYSSGGQFEQRDLELPLPSGTLDFVATGGGKTDPATLYVAHKICEP